VIYPNEQNRRPLLPRIAGPEAQRGRAYERVDDGVYSRFPERTSTSMAYDVGLIRSAVATAGLDEVDLVKGFMHTPLRRPGLTPAIERPPTAHPCDVVAARKPAVTDLG
jgi:hypothetical protein